MIVYSEINKLLESVTSSKSKVLEIGGVPGGYLKNFNPENITRTNIFWIEGLHCIADAQDLPFDDCEFDLVFMVGVDYYIADINKSSREIYRVLKAGGVLINATYSKSSLDSQKLKDTYAIHSFTDDQYLTMYSSVGFRVRQTKVCNNPPNGILKASIWFLMPKRIRIYVSKWRIFTCKKYLS